MKFAATLRLVWIDAWLARGRALHRSDLCAAFGISVPQASKDINAFVAAYPRAITYERSQKAYRRAADVPPVFPAEVREVVLRTVMCLGVWVKDGGQP